MCYRIALKFRGSKFSRITVFENFVEIFSRIFKNALTYGRGYFTSCIYVRTRVAYLTCLLLSQMPTFEVEAMVRGYHAYQDSCDALIGEELVCAREPDNLRDPFAVAVVKSDAAQGGTSLASAPCGSGSLHLAYCVSSRLKYSNRAIVDVCARTLWSTSMR